MTTNTLWSAVQAHTKIVLMLRSTELNSILGSYYKPQRCRQTFLFVKHLDIHICSFQKTVQRMPPSWYKREITGRGPPCWHCSPEAASRQEATLWWALNTTAEIGHPLSVRMPLGPSHTCVVFLRQCKSTWPLRGMTETNQQSEFQKLHLCRAPVGRKGCTSVMKGKHPCCGPALCVPCIASLCAQRKPVEPRLFLFPVIKWGNGWLSPLSRWHHSLHATPSALHLPPLSNLLHGLFGFFLNPPKQKSHGNTWNSRPHTLGNLSTWA